MMEMNDGVPFGSMESTGGPAPSLKAVAVEGDVRGLFFLSTIRQDYLNESSETLEVVYTFPLGWGAALLGLSAELGGKRLEGVVVGRSKAEEQYEKSLEKGDSAILLQKSARGLYTANLGNVKPGERVVVEIRSGQLLRFEQGRVRISVPTVVSERYGDEHATGGLARHETTAVDVRARYGFSLRLTLHGEMAEGRVSCPTHPIHCEKGEDCVTVRLSEGARLDRDCVLLVEGLSGRSLAVCAPDAQGEGVLALASFAPDVPEEKAALALKILVDCSGSMGGGRIGQAKVGLRQVMASLARGDAVSYSCFGSGVEHQAQLICDGAASVSKLAKLVEATDANMGGTEMQGALLSTFELDLPGGEAGRQPCVLLITDGDVWDVERIIASARKCGHRIFAVGVGSAPAESLLRDMAEQSGGACELVTPGERIAEAIVRMFHRMRGAGARGTRIDWGAKPIWESTLSPYIYDGETVHAFAVLAEKPAACPVLRWESRGQESRAQADRLDVVESDDLVRMGRVRQMEETDDEEARLNLALKYQLVSDQTSFILTYERAEGDKATGLPKLEQIRQMPAHGHGCYSRHADLGAMSFCCHIASFAAPRELELHAVREVSRFARESSVAPMTLSPGGRIKQGISKVADALGDSLEAFLKSVTSGRDVEVPDLEGQTDAAAPLANADEAAKRIVACWQARVLEATTVLDCLREAIEADELSGLRGEVAKLQGSLTGEQVWALVAEFLLEQEGAIDRHSRRLLRQALSGVAEPDRERVRAALKTVFGG